MNPAAENLQNSPEDVFQALQLRDIHLPASPELWPPAPGWWIVGITALVLLLLLGFRLFRFWQRRRLQKEAIASLDALQRDYDDEQIPQFLAAVSVLLRRVAIMKFPRQQVASLTGRGWLSFLDLHGGDGQYSNGAGSVLADGPYARNSNVDKEALLSLARKWIKRNLTG